MILLQSASNPSTIVNFLFIGGMVVVFYFFMIRPQQQRQKEQKNFTDTLEQGDLVVTTGGIHGKVLSKEGNTVTIEIDRGVKMKCEKSAISYELSKALKEKETKA
jgi:preprotein translocase subunit YajC